MKKWLTRARALNGRVNTRLRQKREDLSGEGWRGLALTAIVFYVCALVFLIVGQWLISLPTIAVATVLLSQARSQHQKWSNRR
jgi:Flp pilus assembly protein TadB